jgi:hypothetical protein
MSPMNSDAKTGNPRGHGVAYILHQDGQSEVCWSTSGWYSPATFLSEDGRHLVRIEPYIDLSQDGWSGVGVAFYERGNMIKKYTVGELVKDRNYVFRSVSHGLWLDARSVQNRGPLFLGLNEALPYLSPDNRMVITTCDGWKYVFDVASGTILSRTPVQQNPTSQPKPREQSEPSRQP